MIKSPRLYISLLTAVGLALVAPTAARAAGSDWTVDPVPYYGRTNRLHEISVQRFVPRAGDGRILERRYLMTAGGLLAAAGDVELPGGVAVPEAAYNQLLVTTTAWLAYGQLGPSALANFELVSDAPLAIGDRRFYAVRLAPGANGNSGVIPNLSTRAEVRPGVPAIGGFAVTSGRPRTMLIRAIGPGLAQFGVTNALAAVRLQLFMGDTLIATNDDWAQTPAQAAVIVTASSRAGAFPLIPGVRDAAMSITLPPGNYTVHAGTFGGASGTVLLEFYPLE